MGGAGAASTSEFPGPEFTAGEAFVSRRRAKYGRHLEGDPGPRIFSAAGESGGAA